VSLEVGSAHHDGLLTDTPGICWAVGQVWVESDNVIRLKRVYEEPGTEDGFRILVERLWPRGLTKDRVAVDLWLKELAPSSALRTWYAHDRAKWEQFCERYWAELKQKNELVNVLRQKSEEGTVTLVYAARDEHQNSAVALKRFVERE
jgi:uncharacterized protein YeaO (DUF488 family)